MKQLSELITKTGSKIARLVTIALLVAVLAQQVAATTYISAEPIPNQDVVGQNALDLIESVGYSNLELWSNRLLNQCNVVQNVIDVLTSNGAITTINSSNTRFRVAAGGFEGVTNPSFVFTVEDSGPDAASAADVLC
jgi:hypothetical protein